MRSQLLREALAPRLREARRHTGLSARDYGELMGVSARTVFRWEAGTKTPELESLCRIASYSGVSLAWLLYDLDERRGQVAQEGR